MSTPDGEEGQGAQFFLARMGEQLLIPGLPAPQPAPAGVQYKRCNCKKAKCLKLYCVCFGAGVYCQGCNCIDCSNVPEKQHVVFQERQRVLQREPMAFTSKVVGPAHFKGCKCRKSRCVKKYCDCFDARVRCSEICKCKDCQNQLHNFPGAGGVAGMVALQQQQQPGSLLVTLQQQQYTADAMEVDLSSLARMQLLQPQQQEQAMTADLQQQPAQAGQHPGSLPTSQPGSQPPSEPGSRAASPQPANTGTGRSGVQLGVPGGLAGVGQLHIPASVLATAAAASSAAGCEMSSSSGGLRAQLVAASSALPRARSTAQPAAVSAAWGSLEQTVGVGGDSGNLPVVGIGLQLQQGSWQQLHSAANGGVAVQNAELPVMSARAQQQQAAAATAAIVAQLKGTRRASHSSGDREGSLPTEQVLCTEDRLTETPQQQQQERHSREPSVSLAVCKEAQFAAAAEAAYTPAERAEGCQQNRGADMLLDLAAGAAATEQQILHLVQENKDALTLPAEPTPSVRPGLRSHSSPVAEENLSAAAPTQGRAAATGPETGISLEQLLLQDASIVRDHQQQQQYHIRETDVQEASVAAEPPQQQQVESMVSADVDQALPGQQQQPSLLQQQGSLRHQYDATAAATADSFGAGQPQHDARPWDASASCHQHLPPVISAALTTAAASADAAAPAVENSVQQQPLYQLTPWSATLPASQALTAAEGNMPSNVSAPAAAAAAATAAAGSKTVIGPEYRQSSTAAAGLIELDASALLADPACAGQLAQNAGLGESIAVAAMNAAQFLRDIISLSRFDPAAAGMPIAATSVFAGISTAQQQPAHAALNPQKVQSHVSRLRHGALGSPAVGSSSSQVAVLTDQPLAAIVHSTAAAAPANSGGCRSSPLVPGNAALSRHAPTQHAPPAPTAAAAATAAAGTHAFAGFAGCAIARGLSSLGGTASTPSPLTSHALRHGGGSFRGPSPLGPVGVCSREAAGLHSLLGPGKHQQIQQHQGHTSTPVAAPPHMHSSMAPGSGTGSAAGGPGGSSSARRSMQLLPGSFRLTGANQSPAVSYGSPAPGPEATSAMLSHALGSHLAPAGQKDDSPAGSISLAPSVASAGPNDQTANQEQTPVFSNSLKAQQLHERQAQQEQHQQEQQPQAEQPLSGITIGGGAQTPISELTMAAAAAAAAGTSAAPTPTFWQQQAHQAAELDQLLGLNLFSSGQGAAGASFHDMTPSSLLIASLLAAGSTPTDMLLTSPLPPIASALRAAAATGGPASGIRAAGIRGGEVTPVLIDAGHGATGSGSTGGRRKGGALLRGHTGRAKSGVGVSALCTGWSSGAMAAPAPVTARNSSIAAAVADGSATAVTPARGGGSIGTVATTAAAAGSPASQHDAPASGIKADTDKAAARAVAAAAGDAALHHEAPGLSGDVCDAGVSSLLAAANFISTPVYEDEVPAKRRRHDASMADDLAAEHRTAHSQGHKQQQQYPQGVSQLDTKHAADAAETCDKLLAVATAATAVGSAAATAAASSAVSIPARAQPTLLPAKPAAEHPGSPTQAGCLSSPAYKGQQPDRPHSGSCRQQQDWGSQAEVAGVLGIQGLSNQARGSQEQPEQQQQQQQRRGQKRSLQHELQQPQAQQLTRLPEEMENVEPHLPVAATPAGGTAHAGMQQNKGCHAAAAAAATGRPQGSWKPGSPAAPGCKYHPAFAAKAFAAEVVCADQDAGLLQSPPVRPGYAGQVTSDRSPSIESFAAADAMLALCDPLHFRPR